MTFLFSLKLPYPPSINHSHFLKRGRHRKPHVRRFFDDVAAAVLEKQIQPVKEPLAVRVVLYPPDRRLRDIDNSVKILLDALCAARAINDDSQVLHMELVLCRVYPGGMCFVSVFSVGEDDIEIKCTRKEWAIGNETIYKVVTKRGGSGCRSKHGYNEQYCVGNTHTNRKRNRRSKIDGHRRMR